ncbi:MAG TPA: response regulator [Chryseosolibacter sp.]|nr:response regulator [Chryseosolibacter sp.]
MNLNLINPLQNILYIEDDSDDQAFFQESLNRVAPNAICYIANDANEARDFFKEVDVSLDYIFLDINMPGTDGITFLREIKANLGLHSIPVIVYSTSGTESYIRQCKDLGAFAYVKKPNTFQGICNVLKGIMRRPLTNP